jgi:voltage-gated sodium channel
VLTFCFVAEALLKVTAWGRAYFADPFNLYDLAVTVAALASFIVASVTPGGGAGGLSGLRAVRILRLLRLLTVLPALQRFLRVLARVLARCIAFFGIVALTGQLLAAQPAIGMRARAVAGAGPGWHGGAW